MDTLKKSLYPKPLIYIFFLSRMFLIRKQCSAVGYADCSRAVTDTNPEKNAHFHYEEISLFFFFFNLKFLGNFFFPLKTVLQTDYSLLLNWHVSYTTLLHEHKKLKLETI